MCVGAMPSCCLDYEGCTKGLVCARAATACLVESSLAGTLAAITNYKHSDVP